MSLDAAARAWCAHERGDDPSDDIWAVVGEAWRRRAATWLQPLIDAEKQQAVEEALDEVVRRVEADVADGYVWSRVVGSMREARRPASTEEGS